MTYKVLFVNPLQDYISRLQDTVPAGFELKVMPPGSDVA